MTSPGGDKEETPVEASGRGGSEPMSNNESPEPIGPGFSERLAKLSPDKRALLRTRLSAVQRLEAASEAVPLEAIARTADLPLSFAQQRLWFLDRLLPGSSTYNMATAWRLKGCRSTRRTRRGCLPWRVAAACRGRWLRAARAS